MTRSGIDVSAGLFAPGLDFFQPLYFSGIMEVTMLRQFFSPRMPVALLMGFACGVPLLLSASVLPGLGATCFGAAATAGMSAMAAAFSLSSIAPFPYSGVFFPVSLIRHGRVA